LRRLSAADPTFNRAMFGRLLRGARIICGHDTVASAVAAMEESTGVGISERTFYALERGEQEPTVTQYIALVMAFPTPGNASYWDACLRDDVAAYFQHRRRP